MSHPKSSQKTAPLACLSVDLDSIACYRDIHGLAPATESVSTQPDPAYSAGVRRLLDFFNALGVPSTLFVVGSDTAHPVHAEILAGAAADGHELGNHTFSHFYDLPERSIEIQRLEIARGEEAIESVSGRRPVGYRAPGYNISSDLLRILADRGYLYDSSVFPCPPYYAAKAAIMGLQRLRGRPSRSAMVDARTLLAPIRPYRPAAGHIWRKDSASKMPFEVPMCLVPGIRFPIIGTSLQLLGATGFDALFPLLRAAHPQVFQLEFHAIDFMDADDLAGVHGADQLIAAQPDLRLAWPKKREIYRHVIHRLRETYQFATIADAVSQTTA